MMEVKFVVRVRRGPSGLGIAVNGVSIISDLPGSGAAAADGLLALGDEVVGVDGEALEGRPMGAALTPGLESYDLTIVRRGGPITESVAKLSGRPFNDKVPPPTARLLSVCAERDPSSGGGLGLDLSGANVLKSVTTSHAFVQAAEWREGDVIVGVDGQLIGSKRVADSIVKGQQSYMMMVLRDESAALFMEPQREPLSTRRKRNSNEERPVV